MNKNLAIQILEAILLSSRNKIKKSTLNRFFTGFDLKELINLTNKRYKNFGFFIYEDKDSVELVTKPELAKYLINFFGLEEENELIQEFLEVLAIVAYGGPISLKEINKLRGQKSSFILKELLNNGFIKKEKKYYRISYEFLKILGFKSEKELPDYHELRKEIKDSE